MFFSFLAVEILSHFENVKRLFGMGAQGSLAVLNLQALDASHCDFISK
jgi:hypothetical protein